MLFWAWWQQQQPGEPRASLLVEHWAKQTFAIWQLVENFFPVFFLMTSLYTTSTNTKYKHKYKIKRTWRCDRNLTITITDLRRFDTTSTSTAPPWSTTSTCLMTSRWKQEKKYRSYNSAHEESTLTTLNITKHIIRQLPAWSHINVLLIDLLEIPQSVMHYGGADFGNGRTTIQTLDPTKQNVIGQRNGVGFVWFSWWWHQWCRWNNSTTPRIHFSSCSCATKIVNTVCKFESVKASPKTSGQIYWNKLEFPRRPVFMPEVIF